MVPSEVRRRVGLDAGVPLVLVDTPRGLVLLTRSQLKDWVRGDLEGLDLVDDLLEERRAASAVEDSP